MFSLRTLLIAVAIAAIGAGGLATRSLWWASAMMMVALATLVTAVLIAIARPGQVRLSALGFVVFAGFYALVTLSNLFEPVKYSLPTTRAIAATWQWLDVTKPLPVTEITQDGSNGFSQMVYELFDDEQYASHPLQNHTESPKYKQYFDQVVAFFTISHCLFTLAFGFLGAMLGPYLSRRPDSTPTAHD